MVTFTYFGTGVGKPYACLISEIYLDKRKKKPLCGTLTNQHIYANIVCEKVLAGYVALPPRVDTCSRVYLLSKHCDVWYRFVRFAQINKKK